MAEDGILLIFDGVDDEETLTYVRHHLPQKRCTTLLVSSRLHEWAELENFSEFSLRCFNEEEAVAFLMKAVGNKDDDAKQALILAKELHRTPLALTQAAAFIKSTAGYTFCEYLKELRKTGLTLWWGLRPPYASVPRRGETQRAV